MTDKLFCDVIGLRTVRQRARLEGLEHRDKAFAIKTRIITTDHEIRGFFGSSFLCTFLFGWRAAYPERSSNSEIVGNLYAGFLTWGVLLALFILLFFPFFLSGIVQPLLNATVFFLFDEIWSSGSSNSSKLTKNFPAKRRVGFLVFLSCQVVFCCEKVQTSPPLPCRARSCQHHEIACKARRLSRFSVLFSPFFWAVEKNDTYLSSLAVSCHVSQSSRDTMQDASPKKYM